MKLKIPIFYSLFLLILLELTSFVTYFLMQEKMVFRCSLVPPLDYTFESYDSKLGWRSLENRGIEGAQLSCFGDSFTFGSEVPRVNSWVEILNKKYWPTSNFGVEAYGIDQSLLSAKEQLKNSSPFFLLSFISENIARNLNVYRPFYYPNSGTYFTKPRFFLEGEKLVLFENPIPSKEELQRLFNFHFLDQLGSQDFFYGRPPSARFPYARMLTNGSFWKQVLTIFQQKKGPRETAYHSELWRDPEAFALQKALLHEFSKLVVDSGKKPLFMHLPRKWEVQDYLKNQKLPISVRLTWKLCDQKKWTCWFPLLEKSLWNQSKVEELFAPGGHYSVEGNKKIAQFVGQRLEQLKQRIKSDQ